MFPFPLTPSIKNRVSLKTRCQSKAFPMGNLMVVNPSGLILVYRPIEDVIHEELTEQNGEQTAQ